ncbi:MAG: UDP-N-acetylmuramoyl-L-alanine--D-glutamate ligase [Thiotrichaceae bacterium]|nr:UDP-N-acetylmuramoyl-L-alanine--D-glutamate ligase [Thiotrichaceae bacterium]
MNLQNSPYIVVLGMGKTGLACTRFLRQQDKQVYVMDNRENPPNLAELQQQFPDLMYKIGGFDAEVLAAASSIVISPGLSLREPALEKARAKNIPIISEIELFARAANAPVVAITGSNGKSTVTTLVGEMAQQAGWRVQVGGNLGTPALELLCEPAPDLYVLELSSFQLETTFSLQAAAAVVLNISEDHLDRHDGLADYIAIKQRVYHNAQTAVINEDEACVMHSNAPQRLSFSLKADCGDFHVISENGEHYLARKEQTLIPVKTLKLQGAIMRSNVLAALALGEAVGIPMPAMLKAAQEFRGLPHRCVWVGNKSGADWFNDSKGTNIGASIAAIQGLERPKQIILIAGGEGKGADFTQLAPIAREHLRACVLIGRDAPIIADALAGTVPLFHTESLEAAVQQCADLAQTGDAVLLSPACASFDMFTGYDQRGKLFTAAVEALPQ